LANLTHNPILDVEKWKRFVENSKELKALSRSFKATCSRLAKPTHSAKGAGAE
jgi:hypothetical protein